MARTADAARAIGAVCAQSSTTVISKQLTEQAEENSRHGRLGLAPVPPERLEPGHEGFRALGVESRPELERTSLTASHVNWIAGTPPAGPVRVTAPKVLS